MKVPKLSKNLRVYIRPMRDYGEDAQRKEVEHLNPRAVYVDKPQFAGDRTDYRAAWIDSLRPSEGAVAVVSRLWVLAKPQTNGSDMRPSADFIATMTEVLARGVPIVEAASGISSQDLPAWRGLMEKTAKRIAVGRGHSPRLARKIGKLGAAMMKQRAVSTKWRSPEMAAERKKYASVWRDLAYANATEALAALPDEIDTESMARRIFGKRMPRVKTGRPRKQQD